MLNRQIADVTLKSRVRHEATGGDNPFKSHDLRDEFAGKKIVLFSQPGAFTPTFNNEQCQAFGRLYEDLCAAGADEYLYGETAPEKVFEALPAL